MAKRRPYEDDDLLPPPPESVDDGFLAAAAVPDMFGDDTPAAPAGVAAAPAGSAETAAPKPARGAKGKITPAAAAALAAEAAAPAIEPLAVPSGPSNWSPGADSTGPAAPPAPEGYVVLARRYRPQTFDEIVGQENAQTALRGAIASGRIGHAYLLHGPRGTGKTSTARILAKAVNCLEGGPRPDPCGRCASCVAITAGSSLDVIEIDAASNTGVDNIRELRSGVVLAPFSRFKVYIIDEVHMLSTQAFNALLKTLEEPPSAVIFVLATTDPHKVPDTILSRCQVFGFRRFTAVEIATQLDAILTKEIARRGVAVDDGDRDRILDMIARASDGGMRDAQVALDQVLVLSGDRLDYETVRRFLGTAGGDLLDGFVSAIRGRRTDELLEMIDGLSNSGQDLELFVKNLTEHARDLLILRTAPDKPDLVNLGPDRRKAMTALALELPTAFLLSLAQTAMELLEEMKGSGQGRFLLEFAAIKLTRIDPVDDVDRIVERLRELEKLMGAGGGGQAAQPVAPQSPARVAQPAAAPPAAHAPRPPQAPAAAPETPAVTPEPTSPPAADGGDIDAMAAFGQRFIREVQALRAEGLLHALAETCLVALTHNQATLGLPTGGDYLASVLDHPQNQATMKAAATAAAGRPMTVRHQFVKTPGEPLGEPPPLPEDGPSTGMARADGLERVEPMQEAPAARGPVVSPAPAPAPAPAPVARPGEPEARRIVMSDELREATKVSLKGAAREALLAAHDDLRDLAERLKAVFGLNDGDIVFREATY